MEYSLSTPPPSPGRDQQAHDWLAEQGGEQLSHSSLMKLRRQTADEEEKWGQRNLAVCALMHRQNMADPEHVAMLKKRFGSRRRKPVDSQHVALVRRVREALAKKGAADLISSMFEEEE